MKYFLSKSPWASWLRGFITGTMLVIAILLYTGQIRWW